MRYGDTQCRRLNLCHNTHKLPSCTVQVSSISSVDGTPISAVVVTMATNALIGSVGIGVDATVSNYMFWIGNDTVNSNRCIAANAAGGIAPKSEASTGLTTLNFTRGELS